MGPEAGESARGRAGAAAPARVLLTRIGRYAAAMQRHFRRHPRQADVALALGASGWHLLGWFGSTVPASLSPLVLVLVLCLPTLPLCWRRTHPWSTFAAVVAGYLVWLAVLSEAMHSQIAMFFVLIALYSVACNVPPPRSMLAAVAVAVVMVLPELHGLSTEAGPVLPLALSGAAVLAFILAIPAGIWWLGYSQRRLRENAARLRRLTAALQVERDRNARQAVLSERARIARDLHDVVAHHVSAIAVLARAMGELVTDDPRSAREGIETVGRTADAALVDMRRLVGLLAAEPAGVAGPGGGAAGLGGFSGSEGAGLAPEGSLRHLDQLTQVLVTAGCQVRLEQDGIPAGLDPAVAGSAYRIVQEALTNVLKHAAPTSVQAVVRHRSEHISIVVDSGPPGAGHVPVAGSGLGLVGLRERTALFGGTLSAGPRPDGGWRLAAELPTPAVVR